MNTASMPRTGLHARRDFHMDVMNITRQMIVIVGGEPELCCDMARRGAARLSERVGVYVRPHALRVRKCCPEGGGRNFDK